MSDLRIAIAGAGGRMGGAVIRLVDSMLGPEHGPIIHSAFDRPGSPAVGQSLRSLYGIPLDFRVGHDAETALEGADALIDFTAPAVSVMLAEQSARRGLVHIIGTTGCSREEDWSIQKAGSAGARIVKSGNFSLGINMLLGLVRQAARALPGYDIEVLEMHHNRKVDAPSGTALMLGRAAAEGRGIDLDQHAVKVRDGHTGPREAGSIGFAALRGGGVIGEHSVILAGDTERIVLSHSAQDRGMFAAGAVQAALWAADQPPGYYTMADVLGFKE